VQHFSRALFVANPDAAPSGLETLDGGRFYLAILIWVCVLSVLSLALVVVLCRVSRRLGCLIHRGDVAGLARLGQVILGYVQ